MRAVEATVASHKRQATMEIEFEWDSEKAKNNLRRHKVSFQEAATIFYDPFVATRFDPDHSEDEERYVSIGISIKSHLLVVAHTERGRRTRIISSRIATARERRIYEESK